MNATKFILCYPLLLLILISKVNGQSGPLSEEYSRIADEYKKNLKPDSALIYYEKAAVEFQSQGNIEKFINAYNQIGIILTRQDNYEKAKTYLDSALEIGLSNLDSNNLLISTTYISLGVVYNAEENYEQSLQYHHKALSIRLSVLGENHPEVATSMGI